MGDHGSDDASAPAPVVGAPAPGAGVPAPGAGVPAPDDGATPRRPAPAVPVSARPPVVLPHDIGSQIPETLRYRLKNRLLGPPLVTEQLSSERLGRVVALGVLAPDCISSSAYGTEEMLTQLVPYVGLAAFTLVVPITLAILGVLFFVTLSYRDVIAKYTKAGGSYVVARDNFGPKVALVAAVALLIDYTVTVAVQTAAGTAALTSAEPALVGYTVPITVGVVLILLYGNLRGIREAGKYFAFPTYFFIVSLGTVVVVGFIRAALGELHARPLPATHLLVGGRVGTSGTGLLMGLAFISLLRSFANGGSSLTGLEAISNGVSSFRRPESKHARQTLVLMSCVLGTLVLGVTMLARWTHAVPFAAGSPTVVYQEVESVFGTSGLGRALVDVVQLATMLVLYTGGNTSFNGFPFLANFVAGDSFLPRQLTRRGHRLSFSNGILVLAVVAIALTLVFRARVDGLVSLYAIGVFTGFAMAGSGMVKHHLTEKGPHWRRSVAVNGISAVITAAVVLIFAVAKFKEGAWVVVVLGPLMYWGLLRLHHQYVAESRQLEIGAPRAVEAPILRRHVVVVLVDRFDLAVARAIQYARTLSPNDLWAVHFDVDSKVSSQLDEDWSRLGFSRLPLDLVECPDRRMARAALELVADAVVDGDTECTVLLPRREYGTVWERFLHDRTADKIAGVLSQVPHVSATIVPFNLSRRMGVRGRHYRSLIEHASAAATARPVGPVGPVGPVAPGSAGAPGDDLRTPGGLVPEPPAGTGPVESGSRPGRRGKDRVTKGTKSTSDAKGDRDTNGTEGASGSREARSPATSADRALAARSTGTTPIGGVGFRERVRVAGRVKSVRVQPRAGAANLECVLADGSGALMLVFQGRPKIPGIQPGARLVAEGMVGAWGRRLAILNPDYELVPAPADDGAGSGG